MTRAGKLAVAVGMAGMLALTACRVDAAYQDTPANNCRVITENPVAQTFQAGRNGVLTSVSAILGTLQFGDDPAVAPVRIDLVTTSIGGSGTPQPTSTVLGTGTWSGPRLANTATFADVNLSPTPTVTAGTSYALVFTNTNPAQPMCVWNNEPGSYADGQLLVALGPGPNPTWQAPLPASDALFKTWMSEKPDASFEAVPADNCRVAETYSPSVKPVAQTFRANTTGSVERVSAILGTVLDFQNPADAPITITVQTLTPQGRPSGTVLGTGTWAGPALANTSTFADITLTIPAPVTAGTSYALVFTNVNPDIPMCVWAKAAGGYPDGQLLVSDSVTWTAVPGTDALFKTWVVAD